MLNLTQFRRPMLAIIVSLAAISLSITSPHSAQGALVIVPDSSADSVWVRVMFPVGSAEDPPGREGLAHFSMLGLHRGSSAYAAAAVADSLKRWGASMRSQVGRETITIDGSCPNNRWPAFSSMLVDLITRPVYDPFDNALNIRDHLRDLQTLRDDDRSLARAALEYWIYRPGPYALPPAGRDGTARLLRRDDAIEFWRDHFGKSNLMVGLAGPIDLASAGTFEATIRSKLHGEAFVPRRRVPTASVDGLTLYLIERPGTEDVRIAIGAPVDCGIADSSLWPLYVGVSTLGGIRGRLTGPLVELRAICSGLNVELAYAPLVGRPILDTDDHSHQRPLFIVETETVTTNATFALHIALIELARVLERGPTDADIARAKEQLRKRLGHPERLRNSAHHRMLTRLESYRLTVTDDSLAARIAEVEPGAVRDAMVEHLSANNMLIVMTVPDANALARQLLDQKLTYTYPPAVSIRALREEDNRYLSERLPWSPSRVRVVPAEEMFR
ncbi:MAG TPA: insulinase family protein [candidate division Zixibacteria bacterium]